MNNVERLLSFLPPHLINQVTRGYLEGSGAYFNTLESVLREIYTQRFPNSVTWALPLWEYEYGLTPNPGDSVEARRRRLQAAINASNMNPRGFVVLLNQFMTTNNAQIKRRTSDYRVDAFLPLGEIESLKEMTTEVYKMMPATTEFYPILTEDTDIAIKEKTFVNVRRYHRVKEFRVGYAPMREENEVRI